MVLDYTQMGLSAFVFILYILSVLLLWSIRKKLRGNSRTAFAFFIASIFIVAIRRLQQIFAESEILSPVPYSAEAVTIGFAMFFFLGVFFLNKSIKETEK